MRIRSFIFYLLLTILFPLNTSAQTVVGFSVKDSDGDALSDYQEATIYHTDWSNPDTDGDGYLDGEEVKNGYSPLHGNNARMEDVDTDKDGVSDLWEYRLGMNILKNDSDDDGVLDFNELKDGKKEIIVDVKNLSLKVIHNNIVLEEIPVSTGRRGWETPKGDFAIKNKVPFKDYFNHPKVPNNLEFAFNKGWKIYIHSADWHDVFGKKNVSTGCVNVPAKQMKKIYSWADVGTSVTVY